MLPADDAEPLRGASVRDRTGAVLGSVGEVFTDGDGAPTWITVRSGLLRRAETFAPLDAAAWKDGILVLDVTAEELADAPSVDTDSVDPRGHEALAEHYHVGGAPS